LRRSTTSRPSTSEPASTIAEQQLLIPPARPQYPCSAHAQPCRTAAVICTST
jgi:hypothetical protein